MIDHNDIRIDRAQLHPLLNYKLHKLLVRCNKKGIYLIITDGYRTVAYQDALYAKGRTTTGNIVTNARGNSYSSQHQWGIAFDVAINDSKLLYDTAMISKVSKVAKKLGLGWGGDWTTIVDIPHFYLKSWGDTTTNLKSKYGTPSQFKDTWQVKVTKKGGCHLWKNTKKLGYHCNIPYGNNVDVMFSKLWYTKVKYRSMVGYVNKKCIK